MATRLAAATSVAPRKMSPQTPSVSPVWSRGDFVRAIAWFGVAVLARAPLAARVEGVLDHDQSIVGLMALDIAAGRRWPIFFDGQRYMGAVEPYVSALFVALFGHSPSVVALSPLLFFGLFVAAQYALWRTWTNRATAHTAALIAVLSAPMLAIWSVVPRGGYIELLAWAVPVLGIYRSVTRSSAPPLTGWKQAGWGFLLTLGYYVNPLSLIVYVTLALDWTLGRHGADLRRDRGLSAKWLDHPLAPLVWLLVGCAMVLGLGLCCHVGVNRKGLSPFVFFLDLVPPTLGLPLALVGMAGILGGVAVWSGGAGRLIRTLASHPYFALGGLVAFSPFVVFQICLALGWLPPAFSLPIWIRPPWDIGVNVRDGVSALGTLVGCDPRGPATVLIGQGVDSPAAAWPWATRLLTWLAPVVSGLVVLLVGRVAWSDRRAWGRFWQLRGEEPASGTMLVLLGLGVAGSLYLLQATSLNYSSTRYLVPTWIFLPGLLASALQGLPKVPKWGAMAFLLAAWSLAQANLWADLNRPSPLRPIAEQLERRGVVGIVAETPDALMIANLTHGRVGAMEFGAKWLRLGERYRGRFPEGRVVTCVLNTALEWFPGETSTGAPAPSFSDALHRLATRYPSRVRFAWRLEPFEVWETDLPLDEILPAREESPLPSSANSTNLSSGARPAS